MLAGIWPCSPPWAPCVRRSCVPQTRVPSHGYTTACHAPCQKSFSLVWLPQGALAPAPAVTVPSARLLMALSSLLGDGEAAGPRCSWGWGAQGARPLPPCPPGPRATAFSGQTNHKRKCN